MTRLLMPFMLLSGCGDKDCPDGFVMNDDGLCLEQSEADADTDADTDTDTDTDTESDCGDGKDNDGDGLIDCDDDECYGEDDCSNLYTITMATTFIPFSGYNYPMYFGWGEGLEDSTGQRVILSANASIELVAIPKGWTGEGFSCEADLYLLAYGDASLGNVGMTYRGGSDGVVDYSFALAPTPDDGSLTWQGSCPITTLPSSAWGFYTGDNTIAREDDAGWSPWYVANVTTTFFYTDVTLMGLGYLYQYEAVIWEGVY